MNINNIDYFDHDADIGIIGRGNTLEAAFIQAALNVFAIMADLSKIKFEQKIAIDFVESDIEFALITWLNQLIAQARIHAMVFTKFELTHSNHHWHGIAYGGPWTEAMDRGTEVKGATLTGLSVRQKDGMWEARCVVDV